MELVDKIDLGRLEIQIFSSESEVLYLIKGDVDEHFTFKKIPKLAKPVTRFKLGGIKTLNSCGVREWVFFMREFSDIPRLELEECSVALVDQFNVVPQTLGRAIVKSFYAPYYCPHCDEEVNYLIRTDEFRDVLLAKKAPEVKHSCGTEMDFDALEDCYFHHVGLLLKG